MSNTGKPKRRQRQGVSGNPAKRVAQENAEARRDLGQIETYPLTEDMLHEHFPASADDSAVNQRDNLFRVFVMDVDDNPIPIYQVFREHSFIFTQALIHGYMNVVELDGSWTARREVQPDGWVWLTSDLLGANSGGMPLLYAPSMEEWQIEEVKRRALVATEQG